MPSLGFFSSSKAAEACFQLLLTYFFPRVEQESDLERSLCPLDAADPLSSFHFSLWFRGACASLPPQHVWQVGVTGPGDMQIPKLSAVTFWLPGAGVALQWHSRGRWELPEPHRISSFEGSEKKGRWGKRWKSVSMRYLIWLLFWDVSQSFPGTSGCFGQSLSASGLWWCGGGEMRATDGQDLVLSGSPVEATGGSCSERTLNSVAMSQWGDRNPKESLVLLFLCLIQQVQPCWGAPGASQCISNTVSAVLSYRVFCHPNVGSSQSSSEHVICHLWELDVGKHGRTWRKSACGT